MNATIGVTEAFHVGGTHVASLWPRPIRQESPPRCYGHGDDWERDETLLAMHRQQYQMEFGKPAPAWTLEQWREPEKRD
jgi:hypothetical protein